MRKYKVTIPQGDGQGSLPPKEEIIEGSRIEIRGHHCCIIQAVEQYAFVIAAFPAESGVIVKEIQ